MAILALQKLVQRWKYPHLLAGSEEWDLELNTRLGK